MTKDKILWTARYVEGDLTALEREEFEHLLLSDEELQQHLADYNDIHTSLAMQLVADNEREIFASTLKDFGRTYFEDQYDRPKTSKLNVYMRWASGIAAVLILGILLWAPWKGNLYEEFASDKEMSVTERGAEKTDLDNAATFFNNKQFEEAKIILASLYEADKSNSLVSYYYSLSLLETNEVAKGRLMLADVTRGESVFKYDAAYELALSYLKEGTKADAKFWLQKIPDGAFQYDKAQELLKKL